MRASWWAFRPQTIRAALWQGLNFNANLKPMPMRWAAAITRHPASYKVAHQLTRSLVVAAAQRKRIRLQGALKFKPRQRAAGVVSRRDAHHNTGVRIALIAGVLAHAVGHQSARLRCCGYHCASWAHAKAVNAAAIVGMVHQLVVCRAQQRVARVLAEPRTVN